MQFQPIVPARSVWTRPILHDALLAVVLATFLSICWSITDWHRVGRLILPDADDMMRLAQVRDWLNGQAFNDWTQYRMAPPFGAPMHWSRINDFGIAGIILAATPLVGRHMAELVAVIVYPALLFACNLFLSARIARRLWSPSAAMIATILAALAYPGIALFIPGRIDHHALQTVVVELTVLSIMRAASMSGGAIAGLLVAVSLVIGLETAPQVAALVGVLCLFWVARGDRERLRLAGFGAGLGAATIVFLLTMRPSFWSPALCDAFTPASSTATLAVSAALLALAAMTPVIGNWRARLAIGAALGAIAIGVTLTAYPSCLTGPYGVMNPFLRRAFLPHIDEANSIFAQPSPLRALAIGGLLLVGSATSVWMMLRRPRRWMITLPIAAVVIVSALVTLAQARGTYIGAPASAPVLAGLILAARRRRSWRAPALIGAWLASAGIVYALTPDLLKRVAHPGTPVPMATTPQILCNTGDTWEQIDRFPPGVTMAPTNMASYLIGATHLSTVGAGYHRNDRGNMAMYRYFLSPPAKSAAIARAWNVTYVAFCPGDFAEIDADRTYPHSLAAMLMAGKAPADFHRLPLRGARLRFYRIMR